MKGNRPQDIKEVFKPVLQVTINWKSGIEVRTCDLVISGRSMQGKPLLLFGRIDKEAILNFMTSHPFGQGHQSRF